MEHVLASRSPLGVLPRVTSDQRLARDALLARWPRSPREPLPLPRLAAALGLASCSLELGEVVEAPPPDPLEVAFALVDPTARSCWRGLLVLSRDDVQELAAALLARSRSAPCEATPGSGIIGAALFGLDRLGGDWLAAGGQRFELTGRTVGTRLRSRWLDHAAPICARLRIIADRRSIPLAVVSPPPAPATTPRRGLPRSLPAVWRDLPTRLAIVVGTAHLPLDELQALAVGDLVLPDGLAIPGLAGRYGAPRLVAPGWEREISFLDERRFVLVGACDEEKESNMGEDPRETAVTLSTPLSGDAAGLMVDVRIEVGAITLPLAAAVGLVPGRILRLDRPVGREVVLRAGEQIVARGLMVEEHGQLAVEIVEVP